MEDGVFEGGIRGALRRSPLAIGYLILVVAMLAGFIAVETNSRSIEREGKVRAHENCEAVNEARQIIRVILEAAASEPRETEETPESQERRERLYASIIPLLDPSPCPPRPE